jgi:YVTN family beta-propeller protein
MKRHLLVGLAFAAVLALCLPGLSWGSGPNELYVINQKPASVSVLDPATWQITATIPLDPEPTAALLNREGRLLFVLHRGFIRPGSFPKAGQGELAVYDLESRQRLRAIPLGWNVTDLVASRDGRYVLCVGEGKGGNKKKPEEYGAVTVVNAQSGEVAATLPADRFGLRVATVADTSRIFVLSLGETAKKSKNAPSVLTVFAPDNPKPLATFPLGRASRLALSADDKWLYALDGGWPSKKANEHKNGQIHVFDTAALSESATYDVGTQPRRIEIGEDESLMVLAQQSFKDERGRMYRLHGASQPDVVDIGTAPRYVRHSGERRGTFIVSHEDLRFLPDEGGSTMSSLLLNPQKGGPQGPPDFQKLGGFPGELLLLPDQNRVALSVIDASGAGSKVAILDLKENRIQRIVTTGRGSVKFGKFMGAMALSMAMTAASYGAGYAGAQASGSPFFFYNVYTFTPAAPNVALTHSADGNFVYALNTQTNDVTIIRVADGEVIDKIPVGGGCRRVALAPGGKFVYAHASGEVSLIDTHSHKKVIGPDVVEGKVHNVYALDADSSLVALTSQRLVMWDTEKGQVVRTVNGFGEPFMLLDPRPR